MPSKYGGERNFEGTPFEPPPGLDPDCLLFLGDPSDRTVSYFQRLFMPVSLGIGLICGSLYSNAAARMPYRAGLYKHVIAGLVGLALGEGCWELKKNWSAEKDLQYYHYMIMHPEDFQAPERKKWADVIQPWIPMR